MTDEELQECIDECCANMGYYPNKMKAAVNSFARHCGGPTEMLAADMKVVAAWSMSMRSALTQSTLNMYTRECRRFFEYLVREGVVGDNPFPSRVWRQKAWRASYLQALQRDSESVLLMERYIASNAFGEKYEDECRRALSRLAKWVGGFGSLPSCETATLQEFLDLAYSSGRDASRMFSCLNGYFEYAVEQGVVALNPLLNVAPPRGRKASGRTRLEVSDVIRVLEHLEGNAASEDGALDLAIASLAVHEGVRFSDLPYLDVGDYRKEDGGCYLVICGPRAGIVALCPETVAALDRYLRFRWDREPEQPLLAKRNASRQVGRYTRESFKAKMKKAMKEAGVYKKGASLVVSRNDLASLDRDAAAIAADALSLHKGSKAEDLLSELVLNRAASFEERLKYGRLTRSDVVRGVLSRKDIETALEKWPYADVFDAIVRYDGAVSLEPRNL